jgi:hypothetical protein
LEKRRHDTHIMSLSIMTLSITTFSITTFSITTLSVSGLHVTLSINDTQLKFDINTTMLCHYAECHSAECRGLFIVMLSVVMLSVVAPDKRHITIFKTICFSSSHAKKE